MYLFHMACKLAFTDEKKSVVKQLARVLLHKGHRTIDERTILHVACSSGSRDINTNLNYDVVEILLAVGADVNARERDGNTHYICWCLVRRMRFTLNFARFCWQTTRTSILRTMQSRWHVVTSKRI